MLTTIPSHTPCPTISTVDIAAGLHVLSETREVMQFHPPGLVVDFSLQMWMNEMIRICMYAGAI